MSETRPRRPKSAVLVALGEAMRAVRKEQGYSQEKLAAHVGLDRSYYGSIERGECKISVDKAEKIARGLDMKLSELLARARL